MPWWIFKDDWWMQTFDFLYNSVIGLCSQFNEHWQKLISVDSIFNELIPSATYTDKLTNVMKCNTIVLQSLTKCTFLCWLFWGKFGGCGRGFSGKEFQIDHFVILIGVYGVARIFKTSYNLTKTPQNTALVPKYHINTSQYSVRLQKECLLKVYMFFPPH